MEEDSKTPQRSISKGESQLEIQTNLNDYEGRKELNWSKYNKSQTSEKIIFFKLLKELCGLIGDLQTIFYA